MICSSGFKCRGPCLLDPPHADALAVPLLSSVPWCRCTFHPFFSSCVLMLAVLAGLLPFASITAIGFTIHVKSMLQRRIESAFVWYGQNGKSIAFQQPHKQKTPVRISDVQVFTPLLFFLSAAWLNVSVVRAVALLSATDRCRCIIGYKRKPIASNVEKQQFFCCTLLACHEGRGRSPSVSEIGEKSDLPTFQDTAKSN